MKQVIKLVLTIYILYRPFENLHITLINRFLLKSMLYPLQRDSRPVNANPKRCIRELRINSVFAA